MNADEVRARWPLGARFVSTRDRTRRVRVVQAHVSREPEDVRAPDDLLLAHERNLYFPSECEVPPLLPLVATALAPPPPEEAAERLRRAMTATETVQGTGNWNRLQQRIAEEAEQHRLREQEERERRAREAEERRREERRRQIEALGERTRQTQARVRQEARSQNREQPSDLKLEAQVAELQRLLFAAGEVLVQIQQRISAREMPMQSGKAKDEGRRLLIDGEEQE